MGKEGGKRREEEDRRRISRTEVLLAILECGEVHSMTPGPVT